MEARQIPASFRRYPRPRSQSSKQPASKLAVSLFIVPFRPSCTRNPWPTAVGPPYIRSLRRKQRARLHRVAQSFISGIGAGRWKRGKISQAGVSLFAVIEDNWEKRRDAAACTRPARMIARSVPAARSRFTRGADARVAAVCGSQASRRGAPFGFRLAGSRRIVCRNESSPVRGV